MHPLLFYAPGRTPRESYSPIRTNAPSKSRFPASPLCIRNALFLTLPKRDLKSHFPQMHSTLFFFAPPASNVTLHECTPHSICTVLLRSHSVIKSHFPQVHLASHMPRFSRSSSVIKATFCKCTPHSVCALRSSSVTSK